MSKELNLNYKEILYQIGIILFLFIFFSYHQDDSIDVSFPSLFKLSKISFFGNYVVAATIINYIYLPFFYYKKKWILFTILVTALISGVILLDEFVIEQIFYPDTRGKYFPGILFSLIETLPVIIILVMFKFAWDFIIKQNEVEQLKSLVQESELQFLKSQINPHFLFNNLNNLYAHSIENSPKTPTIILELSSVLRYMLYDCKENFVPVNKEIEHLKHYTALNKLQIGARGIVVFDTNIENSTFEISPLVLVVFIENAFKHSSETQSQNISIKIHTVITKQGILEFKCENNYSSEYELSHHSKGIGLENVKKRLNLLYPKKHNLRIDKDDTNFKVNLTLKLKQL